ncbi:MAG: hypothetical protein ACTHKB_04495, partial [Burkholderiaceae bacterium]
MDTGREGPGDSFRRKACHFSFPRRGKAISKNAYAALSFLFRCAGGLQTMPRIAPADARISTICLCLNNLIPVCFKTWVVLKYRLFATGAPGVSGARLPRFCAWFCPGAVIRDRNVMTHVVTESCIRCRYTDCVD